MLRYYRAGLKQRLRDFAAAVDDRDREQRDTVDVVPPVVKHGVRRDSAGDRHEASQQRHRPVEDRPSDDAGVAAAVDPGDHLRREVRERVDRAWTAVERKERADVGDREVVQPRREQQEQVRVHARQCGEVLEGAEE